MSSLEGRRRKNTSYVAEIPPSNDADRIRKISCDLLNSGNNKKQKTLSAEEGAQDQNLDDNDDDMIYWDVNAQPPTVVDPMILQQQFLDQLIHDNELVPVEFSMDLDWFTKFLTLESENQAILPRDYDAIFDKHSHLKTTKRAFSIDLQNVMSQHGIKFSQINEIFAVLQRHTTSLNLPILKPNPLLAKKRSEYVRSNLSAYVGKDHRTVVIDVCERDCVAFHGMQFNKKTGKVEDFGELLMCPDCDAYRFSHCSDPKCRDKDYFQCSPFHVHNNVKGHSKRTPMKTVFYRPITAKLLSLYKTSLLPGNDGLLKYFLPKYRVSREGHIIDINDGKEVQNQMEEMTAAFESFRERYNMHTSDDIVFQCSLLLTLFYDGITLFDRNADSLWPLLCSIASCNPSHRSKLGVGMFLAALHNVKPGSGAEKYFIKHILTEELKVLERGILFQFAHPVTSLPHKVFLQARCIFAHLDLPALEHFVKVQGHGSLHGCTLHGCTLCGAFHGQYSKCLGKVIYNGERNRLHASHWLRTFGQTLNNDM